MSGKLVALRYARALYAAASEADALAAVTQDLARLKEIFIKAPQIKQYCQSTHKKLTDELAFINLAFIPYVGKYTQAALQLAVVNGRLASLPLLPLAFDSIMDKNSDIVNVELETAHTFDEPFMQQLKNKLEKRLGKHVRLAERIVPELLGGFRLLWQNKILDLSAAGRLKRLRGFLKNAAT
jgi:F-type H+-transporting ATPase subunit delta